jgi:hypothetical protein
VALLSFVGTPGAQSLALLEEAAFVFADGERPIAMAVRDRENRLEAWVLLADAAAPRALRIERLSLLNLAAAPATTLVRAAPPLPLTDAAGAWLGFAQPSALPSGCLTDLVVAPDGLSVALFDAGSGGRCGALADGGAARVHVLDLPGAAVRDTIEDVVAPGVRAGDVGTLLLARRPIVGEAAEGEVFPVTFAQPRPDFGAQSVLVPGLLDLAATRGGFAALQSVDDGRRVVIHDDTGTRELIAPNGALAVISDEVAALDALLTRGGNRLGVVYGAGDDTRTIAFDAQDATIEPLNAYALAVRSNGGLCLVDMYVPTASTSCDANAPSAIAAALVGAKLVTWTFALPDEPTP